jgi:hypothetical protein
VVAGVHTGIARVWPHRRHAPEAMPDELEARGARHLGGGGEQDLDAIVRRHRDLAARIRRSAPRWSSRAASLTVIGSVRLVLHHDRELEGVTEVQEPRRRRPHHQRQARGQALSPLPNCLVPAVAIATMR